MAFNLGHKSEVRISTTKIGNISSFGPAISMETAEARTYGDAWLKPVVTGRSLTCTIEGFLDLTDAQQLALHDAALDSVSTDAKDVCKIANLRFYEDSTNYWTVDVVTDTDAHFVVTGYNWTPDLSGLIAVTFDVASFGPIERTT